MHPPQGSDLFLFLPFSLCCLDFVGLSGEMESRGQCVHDKVVDFLLTHIRK